jgi:protein-arginine deiminase
VCPLPDPAFEPSKLYYFASTNLDVASMLPLNTFPLTPAANSQAWQEEVLVTGQPTTVILTDAIPPRANHLTLNTTGELVVQLPNGTEFAGKTILEAIPDQLSLLARTYSHALRDRQLSLEFATDDGPIRHTLELTAIRLCLDVDADRDGIVEDDNPAKQDWQWGPGGQGAIFMVNSDQDIDYSNAETNLQNRSIDGLLDLKDLALLVVRKTGMGDLPRGYELWLSVNDAGRDRVRIFEDLNSFSGRELIGPRRNDARICPRNTQQDWVLGLEGLAYRDHDFDGLVEIRLTLERDREPYYRDWVCLRVVPWIMTPNTLAPRTVYIAQKEANRPIVSAIRSIVGCSGAQLEEVPYDLHRGDRWLQDELEIGYTQMPGQRLYVALESPRKRGLEEFPESLLSPDFGHVTRKPSHTVTKLDSFGNLEVSPPVTVNGRDYPLGRILYGDTDDPIHADDQRHFQASLEKFLMAQQVQAPVKLFSDWLSVGHIDEFMTFVPAPQAPKGFKLVLASPNACYQLLQDLQNQGWEDLQLREGKTLGRRSADIAIKDVLADQGLQASNERFQGFITQNRDILIEALGVTADDIIDLPMLFEGSTRIDSTTERADSFFPNIVNMIVLGSHLALPKPFGPRLNGVCQLEAAVRSQLEPLELICHFIDDWDAYFAERGELHCGTNVVRQPFTLAWWDCPQP